jgi:peptidoglycan/LPS O-acetylase OafA/YrhL
LHTWSLAVEEQYYVLFPIALWALWRLGKMPAIAAGLILAGLASYAYALWGDLDDSYRFNLLTTRAWEILSGASAALLLRHCANPQGTGAQFGSLLGAGLIVWSMIEAGASETFPNIYAVAVVLGAVLVIICATPATWVGRLLSLRFMVGIGLISYATYLWHQPLFAFAHIRLITDPPEILMALLVVVSLGLGWLTWLLVENPMRDRAKVSSRVIWAGALAGVIGFTSVGELAYRTDGLLFLHRFPRDVVKMADHHVGTKRKFKNCEKQDGIPDGHCVFWPELKPQVALWGDSHGIAIMDVLATSLKNLGVGTVNLSRPSCRPIPMIYNGNQSFCGQRSQEIFEYLLSDASPPVVILHARWNRLFEQTSFDNMEGGAEGRGGFGVKVFAADSGPAVPLTAADVGERLRLSVEKLRAAGKTVLILASIPEAGWNVPIMMSKNMAFGGGPDRPFTTSARVFADRDRRSVTQFRKLAELSGVHLVEPSKSLCNTTLVGRCLLEANQKPLYRDDDHLSRDGANLVVGDMLKQMTQAGIIAKVLAPHQ